MHPRELPVSGREITFGREEIIVSKTDERGVITYANNVFLRVAGYTEAEIIGKPHNIIRHPGMPRAVFRLMWDTIKADREIFAYVVNRAKNGDAYWVLAHITPSYDRNGKRIGYHSNRRSPNSDAIEKVKQLYKRMLQAEAQHTKPADAMDAGASILQQALDQARMDYGEFVFSLSGQTTLDAAVRKSSR
jgi:PAS domain S-box-containing protein